MSETDAANAAAAIAAPLGHNPAEIAATAKPQQDHLPSAVSVTPFSAAESAVAAVAQLGYN